MMKLAKIRTANSSNPSSVYHRTQWGRCRVFLPPNLPIEDAEGNLFGLRGINELWAVRSDGVAVPVESLVERQAKTGPDQLFIYAAFPEHALGDAKYTDFDLILVKNGEDRPREWDIRNPEEPPRGLLSGDWAITINDKPVTLEFDANIRSTNRSYNATRLKIAEASRQELTLPDGFWLEVYAELSQHDATGCMATLRCGWSTPAAKLPYCDLNLTIELVATGGLTISFPLGFEDRGPIVLDQLNDGQSVAVPFMLRWNSTSDAHYSSMPLVMWQLDAVTSGGFGLLGRPQLALDQSIQQAQDADAQAIGVLQALQRGWFDAAPGFPAESGATGEHGSFGLLAPAGWLFWGSGLSYGLAMHAFYCESARPIWLRDEDGEELDLSSYPRAIFWGERPYPFQGSDMIGKTEELNPYLTGTRTSQGVIWTGQDEQHYENPGFWAYAALSGDPAAEAMAKWRFQLLARCLATNSGNPTIDGTGSGRAARMLSMFALAAHSMQGYFPMIPERVIQPNVENYLKQWRETNDPAGGYDSFRRVMPQQVYGPSAQAGGLPCDHWRPWEDAIVAIALLRQYAYGATNSFGSADLQSTLAIAGAIAANVVLHGMETLRGKDPDGKDITTYRMFTALAYLDNGRPLTEAELANPALARNGAGAGYATWSYGCFVAALNIGVMLGEQVPQLQTQLAPLLQMCEAIIESIRKSQSSCWTDAECVPTTANMEFSEWLAIEKMPLPSWAAAAAGRIPDSTPQPAGV